MWTIAYEIEKARLKYDNPSKYTGTNGNWKLGLDAAWNVSIDGVHIALDGIGLVPVVGEVADLANGILYTMEGDWANGTLAVASAVPFVGWFANGAKYAQKVVNASGNTCRLVWAVDALGEISFGNPSQLRRVIKPAEGYIAHHLLPVQHAGHDVVQLAAKADGLNPWHMNDHLNGLGIANWRHSGSHFNYNEAVELKLNEIALLTNLTPSLAKEKCEYLAYQVKIILNQNPNLLVNDIQIKNLIQLIPIN